MKMREERAEAAAEAYDKGKNEGKAAGRDEQQLESVRSVMESLKCTKERALEILKVPAEKRAKLLALL